MGEDAPAIDRAVGGLVDTVHATSLTAAVAAASQVAVAGDIVLLSPACASFDMFRDYNDRGEQFRALVEGL